MFRSLLVSLMLVAVASWAYAYDIHAPRSDGTWETAIPDGDPPCECVITTQCMEPSPGAAVWHGDGASDLAGNYYRVEVGGGNGIILISGDGACTMLAYCGDLGWGISQRAIAMDPGTGWLTLGSWNNPGQLFTVDFGACALVAVSFLADPLNTAGGWYSGGFHGWITNESTDRYAYTTMDGAGVHTLAGPPAAMPWQVPMGGYTGAGVDIEEHTGRAIFVNQPSVLEAFTGADGNPLVADGSCFLVGFTHGWGVADVGGSGLVAISDALAPYWVRYTGTPGCPTASEPTTWGNVKALYE